MTTIYTRLINNIIATHVANYKVNYKFPMSENFFGTMEDSSLNRTGSALNWTDFRGMLPYMLVNTCRHSCLSKKWLGSDHKEPTGEQSAHLNFFRGVTCMIWSTLTTSTTYIVVTLKHNGKSWSKNRTGSLGNKTNCASTKAEVNYKVCH